MNRSPARPNPLWHRSLTGGVRLNVLMVNTLQTGGGASRAGQTLADGLRQAGHSAPAYVASDPDDDPDCHVVRHWRLTPGAQRLAALGLPELGELTSLLWRCRAEYATADVLHWHNLHGEFVSLAAVPLWGWDKPVVWTLHDFWPLTGNCAVPQTCTRWRAGCGRCPLVGVYPMARVDRSRFYRWLKPRLFAAARPRLVTPSEWLGRRVAEVAELRRLPRRVIRYPIDTQRFVPPTDRSGLRRRLGLAPNGPTVVISGARWADPFKGGADARRALRAARERLPALQVLAVGRDSAALLAATGLPGRALPFLTDRTALAEAYGAADVCLFPSRAENYPLTILEALACGTPVVAYDVGGIPEQVQPVQTGYLARDGHVEELTTGLVTLLSNVAAAREMGARGRAFVVATSAIPVVTAQYCAEYRQAIDAWCRRRGRSTARFGGGALSRRAAQLLGWDSPPARANGAAAAPANRWTTEVAT